MENTHSINNNKSSRRLLQAWPKASLPQRALERRLLFYKVHLPRHSTLHQNSSQAGMASLASKLRLEWWKYFENHSGWNCFQFSKICRKTETALALSGHPPRPLLQYVFMVIDLLTIKLSGWPRNISILVENTSFHDSGCHYLSIHSLHLTMISLNLYLNCSLNCLMHQQSWVLAVAGCVWSVWVWGISDVSSVVFRGYSSFLLLSVLPGWKLTAVHQIRALEEECCFRWESIFPSACGENSWALRDRFR